MMSYRGYDKRDRIQNLWVMSLPNAHAGIGRRLDRQPARRRARGQRAAVDDAARHAGRAHHDSDQPAGEDVHGHRRRATIRSRRRRCRCPRTCAPARPSTSTTRPPARERYCARAPTSSSACRRATTASPGATTRSTAARRDLQAKLRAEKKTDKEIAGRRRRGHRRRHDQADAVRHGVLSALRQEGSHPAAVGDVGAERDAGDRSACPTAAAATTRSKGDGRPWLMLAGTPGAHIMIPINK